PNRGRNAESVAPVGPRGRRQGRAGAPISPKHARCLGRTGVRSWVVSSPRTSAAPPMLHRIKKYPVAGGWFCELTTYTLATCSAWASGHFSAQTARRDSSARCRGDAYG